MKGEICKLSTRNNLHSNINMSHNAESGKWCYGLGFFFKQNQSNSFKHLKQWLNYKYMPSIIIFREGSIYTLLGVGKLHDILIKVVRKFSSSDRQNKIEFIWRFLTWTRLRYSARQPASYSPVKPVPFLRDLSLIDHYICFAFQKWLCLNVC